MTCVAGALRLVNFPIQSKVGTIQAQYRHLLSYIHELEGTPSKKKCMF